MIHRAVHADLDVEGCFGCRVSSVAIAASARGSLQAQEVNAREARWDRDIPAYRRLRADGVQPPAIDGSAWREATANTTAEVEGT